MHVKGRLANRVSVTLGTLLLALLAFPLQALANATVTVSVEGRSSTLLAPIQVEVGNGSSESTTWNGEGKMPNSCPNNTAYQAIEKAVKGNWDRQLFVETILGETLTWAPKEEYWIFYYDHNYAEYGTCAQVLKTGDTVLMQAGVSGPESEEWVPQSIPLELEVLSPASKKIEEGKKLTVRITSWKPSTTIGTEEPKGSGHWVIPPSPASHPAGYTIKAGAAEALTNASGEASLTMSTPGTFTVQASMPGSEKNWSRSAPVQVCVYKVGKTC